VLNVQRAPAAAAARRRVPARRTAAARPAPGKKSRRDIIFVLRRQVKVKAVREKQKLA